MYSKAFASSGMQGCSKFFEWDACATDTFKSDSRDNQNSWFSLSVSTWGVPTEGVVLSIEIQRPLLVIILNISSFWELCIFIISLMVDSAIARSKVLLSECFERKIKSPFLQFWHFCSKIWLFSVKRVLSYIQEIDNSPACLKIILSKITEKQILSLRNCPK